jgi:hypothetical protein
MRESGLKRTLSTDTTCGSSKAGAMAGKSSGSTIRPLRMPIRPLRGHWPAPLERRARRFFWPDPTIVVAPDSTPDEYRQAMKAFTMGGTIKITRPHRHPAADRLLLDHVDVSDAVIVDMGASDGSTSIDLVEVLPDFRSFVISDLYLYVGVVRAGRHTFFYAPGSGCFLVCGPRALAWPEQARTVRKLYAPLLRRAGSMEAQQVLLVNPRAKARALEDPRIGFAVHDVFTPWPGPRPDVIKVANLLRRDYFTDERLRVAMSALLLSLDDGGHLLLVNNPRIAGVPCEGALYRRADGHFEPVATTEHVPDVDDLVRSATVAPVRLPPQPRSRPRVTPPTRPTRA